MRRTPAILIGIGLVLILAASGVGMAYSWNGETIPATRTATPAATSASPALDATLHVRVLDVVDVQRELPVALPLGAALPEAQLQRQAGVDVAPAALGATLALRTAPAGEAQTRVGSAAQVASQSAVIPPAASVALAAAAFTLSGLVAWLWAPLKKLVALPFVALYAKISRAEVFQNGVRERIFAAIRAQPGASATQLARQAGVAWGTTIYHLDVLEQTRMVSSVRDGRHRRYFENGAQLEAPKEVISVMRNPVTSQVVQTLRGAPGLTQKELAAATSMSPQALHWHLQRLVGVGVVRKEREGRVVRHFA